MNKRTLALIPDVKRVLALARSLENRGLLRRNLCGIIMGKSASRSGRRPLPMRLGDSVALVEDTHSETKFLRQVNRAYRKALQKSGSIDDSLKSVRNNFRRAGCWIPKTEWGIIEAALRDQRRFNPAKIAARIAVTAVRDHKHQAAILSRLLNRRLLPSSKPRRK